MKTMRLIMRDRLWSGAIAAALAYLLVLQGLLAGMAQGAMAAASAGPLPVICTSHGVIAADSSPEGESPGDAFLRLHCATLCQLAAGAAPAVLGAQASFLQAPQRQPIAIIPAPADISQPVIQALIAEARAPPVST
jgi:hypothetical protein